MEGRVTFWGGGQGLKGLPVIRVTWQVFKGGEGDRGCRGSIHSVGLNSKQNGIKTYLSHQLSSYN